MFVIMLWTDHGISVYTEPTETLAKMRLAQSFNNLDHLNAALNRNKLIVGFAHSNGFQQVAIETLIPPKPPIELENLHFKFGESF